MIQIAGLSTAVPDNKFNQTDIFNLVKKIFSNQGHDISRYESAFINTEIQSRYSAAPLSWYLEDHSWSDRNRIYIDQALNLLEQVSQDVIRNSEFELKDITDIITVSTTGIATPSLDAMLMDRLKFESDVRRTPIFGLGCAGGLCGLERARQIAAGNRNHVVLLLVVELCSLNFMRKEASKQNIIATALFSDGAAGALISQKATGPKMLHSMEHRWPDSLPVMGWNVNDQGMSVIFSRSIPDLVKQDFTEVFERYLEKCSLKREDFKNYLSHPGGSKVVDELESLFHLPAHSMTCTRDTLRDYGNMSAPTVLFVLKNAVDRGLSGKSLLTTFGPGFTAALMTVEL